MIQATIYFNETKYRHPYVELFERTGGHIGRSYGLVQGKVTGIQWIPSVPCWHISMDGVGRLYVDAIRRAEGDIE